MRRAKGAHAKGLLEGAAAKADTDFTDRHLGPVLAGPSNCTDALAATAKHLWNCLACQESPQIHLWNLCSPLLLLPGRLLGRERLERLPHVGAVGDDALHAERRQLLGAGRVVHGPRAYLQARRAR